MSSGPTADKNLGQHFLSNVGVIEKIVSSVQRLLVGRTPHVIEIGPGQGALTQFLLRSGIKLTAIEFDERMIAHLKERFAKEISEGRFEIIFADATRFDWKSWESAQPTPPQVICGNLPYNVGTTILFQVLEHSRSLEAYCFMLQKEVIQRLQAQPSTKDYGAPSVSVGLLCDFKESFWVSPGSFSPPPKVQSGVLSFQRKKNLEDTLNPLSKGTEYFSFVMSVRKAFQNRRKMLRNSFAKLESTEWGTLRPEQLSPKDWWDLWKKNYLK